MKLRTVTSVTPEGNSKFRRFATFFYRAMAWLHYLDSRGGLSVASMQEVEFGMLRGRDDFKKLLAKVQAKETK